jgi:hypothetical protein
MTLKNDSKPLPLSVTVRLTHNHVAPRLAFIVLLIFSSTQSHSTATNVILGEGGIVIATDTKRGINTNGEHVGEMQGTKMFIVQNRIAIACLGNCGYRFSQREIGGQTRSLDYDFATWVLNIESGLPDKCSFDEFVGIVKSEARKMVPILQPILSSETGARPKDPTSVFEPFIQFVITGYQEGEPMLSVVELYFDWDAKLLHGPYDVTLEPNERLVGHYRYYFFGIQESAEDFLNRDSYAYQKTMACCTKAFQDLISKKAVPLDESAVFARSLIKIEEKTNPSDVGGNIQVIAIRPDGTASDLTGPLPKASTAKQSNAHK